MARNGWPRIIGRGANMKTFRKILTWAPAVGTLTVSAGYVACFYDVDLGARLICGGFAAMIITLVAAMATE